MEEIVSNIFLNVAPSLGKTYQSVEHENYRRSIFSKNFELVNKHNAEGTHSYTLEINKFADLTAEEFSARYKGYSNPGNKSVCFIIICSF